MKEVAYPMQSKVIGAFKPKTLHIGQWLLDSL